MLLETSILRKINQKKRWTSYKVYGNKHHYFTQLIMHILKYEEIIRKKRHYMLISKEFVKQKVVCENKRERNGRNESKYPRTVLTFAFIIITDCDIKKILPKKAYLNRQRNSQNRNNCNITKKCHWCLKKS